MTEAQQYELGSYVNLMEASTQLLVNPIIGLQPKFTEADYKTYFSFILDSENSDLFPYFRTHKNLIITLANLFYAIPLDEKDKKLLIKSFKKNKQFLEALHYTKDDITAELFEYVSRALYDKYSR